MRKSGIILLLALISIAGCKSGEKKGLSTAIIGQEPVMSFDQKVHDFGEITEGEVVSWSFDFTNTGKGDLLIADAHASCGCTIPDYPKDVIHPGDKGTIKVKFNSEGKAREGKVVKTVTIEANTNPKINTIEIRATVNKEKGKK
jgi:hypothetical protein